MRVLIVCRYKEALVGHAAPFVIEQMQALQEADVECRLFLLKGNGIRGYLMQWKPLKRAIADFRPDVVHAHYGLCGLLANMQRKVPVVTTYHGSDINDPKVLPLSKLSMRRSAWNIFVSRQSVAKAKPKNRFSLLPCGVDITALQLTGRLEARQRLGLDPNKRYVLFAGGFDNAVKDPSLAKQVFAMLGDRDAELLELKGYSREEVTLLMCASNCLLMTSVTEGSPQVIKEALACGCPIVSVDVGDVKERIKDVEGCFVSETRNPEALLNLLVDAMAFDGKTKGRVKVMSDGLPNEDIVNKLIKIYEYLK